MARRILACRDPRSKGLGEWDGALIIVENTTIMFIENKDFIGHPSYEEAKETYLEYIEQGWIPMTREDIKETCNFEFSPDDEQTFPRKPPLHYYAMYGVAFALALHAFKERL